MLKQYLSYKTGWRHTIFSCILYLLGMYVKGDTITYKKYILMCKETREQSHLKQGT